MYGYTHICTRGRVHAQVYACSCEYMYMYIWTDLRECAHTSKVFGGVYALARI